MIYAIVGPTCSGKTSLAVALAKKINAEIINFDAFQVYKELNIGTAKPTQKEMEEVKCHLFNVVSVKDEFNIYLFQKACRYLIDKFIKEGKNIVLVGGSGLYLRSVIYDYSFAKEKDVLDEKKYANFTNEELYNQLLSIDEISAQKIHVNNRKRIIRALEIYDKTKETKSSIEASQTHKMIYDVKIIGLNPPRDLLYENISKRVDEMFEKGLQSEVKELFSSFNKDLQAFQAIGYKEFLLNLTPEETKELIKQNTRHYAKRQLTFFLHQFENVKWFESLENALKSIK
jgi:tRNA dimethylallyltransferase